MQTILGRGISATTSRRLVWAAGGLFTLLLFTAAPSPAIAGGPIGYERWTDLGGNSGVFFDKSFAHVYANWSTQVPAPGLPPKPQHDKRLIDIQVRLDEKSNSPKVSGVWIDNAGDHRRKSWLMHGVTGAEIDLVVEYLKLANMIIVDVERYQAKKGQVLVFALLIQENPKKLDWSLWTSKAMFASNIAKSVPSTHRVLDLDWLMDEEQFNEEKGPYEQALPSYYDIVIVANPFGTADYINWDVVVLDPNEVAAIEQMNDVKIVDVDNLTSTHLTAVVVEKFGHTSCLKINLKSSYVPGWVSAVGAVKDLEGGHDGEFGWYTIHENSEGY